MEVSQDDVSADGGALAEVIHLCASTLDHARPFVPVARTSQSLLPAPLDGARDADLLQRRYGDRWVELPADAGRPIAALEQLLHRGPTAADPAAHAPNKALVEGWLVVQAAATFGAVLEEEADVLGEVLGADLLDLPLRQLDQVVGAVLDLGLVRCGDPSWADPVAADATRLVLDVLKADLSSAVATHRELYERFTEQVWTIREEMLRAGLTPWSILGRARLRSQLAAVSRTGKLQGSLTETIELLLRARTERKRLDDLAPMLERHLGKHDQGAFTDIDAAQASLDALQRLQHALGDRLDVERLRGLLMADAFARAELTTPALNLRSALRGWQAELARLCGGDPWSTPAGQLGDWAARTRSLLPEMTAALRAVSALGREPVTMRDLVNDLLLREHVAQVGLPALGAASIRAETGSAS